MTLPNDVARCAGRVVSKPNGIYWHPECVECQRRSATAPDGQVLSYITAPTFDEQCELRIAP